jgi:hypothetical protein
MDCSPKKAYALRHRDFDEKIQWLNGDPEPHWQEEFVPSCLVFNRNVLAAFALSHDSEPGWTEIREFEILEKES